MSAEWWWWRRDLCALHIAIRSLPYIQSSISVSTSILIFYILSLSPEDIPQNEPHAYAKIITISSDP